MKFLSLFLLFILPGVAWADRNEIPLDEQGFVDAIKSADKVRIVGQLGEPARLIEVNGKNGEPVGSIWHYHYLNTSDNGDYYKTTELDFIGDQVVTVVFSMDDADADNDIVTTMSGGECAPTC